MLGAFFIAKRYAQRQVKKTWVHRLSRLTCYSIALGTAVLVLVVSTMNGMTPVFDALFDTHTATLKITPKEGKTFPENKNSAASIRTGSSRAVGRTGAAPIQWHPNPGYPQRNSPFVCPKRRI